MATLLPGTIKQIQISRNPTKSLLIPHSHCLNKLRVTIDISYSVNSTLHTFFGGSGGRAGYSKSFTGISSNYKDGLNFAGSYK